MAHEARTQPYGIHYTAEPGLSYVIEPQKGVLNYRKARTNPLKFYEDMLSHTVIEHKVSKDGQLKSSQTKRSLGLLLASYSREKVIAMVKSKSSLLEKQQAEQLVESIGEIFDQNLMVEPITPKSEPVSEKELEQAIDRWF